jgi:organic radical activating enzyme
MDLRKYKFKNCNKNTFNWFKEMDYLCDKNLSKFKYLNEISEEEFLKGENLKLKEDKNIIIYGYWNINIEMVEKDLKEIRKDKLDGLVNKI